MSTHNNSFGMPYHFAQTDSAQTEPPRPSLAKLWTHYFQLTGVSNNIANVKTELQTLRVGNDDVPLTINSTDYDNSYVCSAYTAYITYARNELSVLKNPLLEAVLRGVIGVTSVVLKVGKINRSVSINNWLVSTNLLPEWSPETVQTLTFNLIDRYPSHNFSIRSLNVQTNPELMHTLTQQGWILMPARQVYLFDKHNPTWWKCNNTQNDQRLLRKTLLTKVLPHEHLSEDFADMAQCFHQLFIEKHSAYNPNFTEQYFEFLHQQQLVEFYSFRNPQGRIIATIGLLTQQDIITTPIVGYDTQQPKELGLYRLLMATLLKITFERGQTMNLSSGAGEFKRRRGGKPEVEYTALYVKHLPWVQKTTLTGLAKIMRTFGPKLLQSHEI
ncbi:GNAT family N-acetyltransferase [Thiomicrorhabdus aquaedulcis]|uniref:GNAT family N-acetyltransferase n=1 Tax=Thiomicrorhabdus aquaedulcis TaxID=2211106 RepID=UPI00156285E3|nr:GNAT family N-acetyltransferase [Thiomicrorhabdus aquaedulcis]